MAIEVQNKSPDQRRHYRVIVPIFVEIDGKLYETANWSISGFKLKFFDGHLKNGDVIRPYMSIPFQGFNISFLAQCRVARIDNNGRSPAFEFVDLGLREQQVLNTFVSGIVTGEMEEVDGVIRRIDVPVTPASLRPDKEVTKAEQIKDNLLRKKIGFTYILAGLALALVLGTVIYTNIFQIEVDQAVMVAPTELLLAPTTGDIINVNVLERDRVKKGEPIMTLIDPKLEKDISLAELKVKEAEIKVQTAKADIYGSDAIFKNSNKQQGVNSVFSNLKLQEESFRRSQEMLKKGLISESAHLESEKKLNEARREESQLQAALSAAEQIRAIAINEMELLRAQRERLTIKAISDGKIIRLLAQKNSSVRYGDPVAIFERTDIKQVSAFLTREESFAVSRNDKVDVYFPSLQLNVPHIVTDIDYVLQSLDLKQAGYTLNTDNERTVTVRLEPFGEKAQMAVETVAPGTAAIVIFENNPVTRYFGRIF